MVAVGEAEAVPRRERHQLNVVSKTFTEQRKQLVEQKRRGDHGGARVMAKALALKNLRPAAKLSTTVDQGDSVTLGAQAQCSRNTAETRTHHHRMRNAGYPACGGLKWPRRRNIPSYGSGCEV